MNGSGGERDILLKTSREPRLVGQGQLIQSSDAINFDSEKSIQKNRSLKLCEFELHKTKGGGVYKW